MAHRLHLRSHFRRLYLPLYHRRSLLKEDRWLGHQHVDRYIARVVALNQAIALRCPGEGLILHSDRGSQFASLAYRQRLQQCNYLQSMSRKGNCYDNAPMESFFKSYKGEEVNRQQYQTHEHATRGVIDYIERFYNPVRLHSSLDYVSPNCFEERMIFDVQKQPA